MNLDIEIPNRNFHELCNVIKWKEAPHTYNKEELQAKSIADALYNNMTLDPRRCTQTFPFLCSW